MRNSFYDTIVHAVSTDCRHEAVSRHEALERARRLSLDLVEVQSDGKPPVFKLMDYKKEMYIRQVKEKELTKKKANMALRNGLKEVKITMKIDKHDLQTKADAVKRLAEKGYRIKLAIPGVGTLKIRICRAANTFLCF
ncbi:translation initiation factor IF3-1, mitochondrial, partial [Tanacetum coccineum]